MEPITTETLRHFDNELEDIRSHVLQMGGLVEKQIMDGVTALVNGDIALGEEVIKNDYQVNKLDVTIDEECSRIITRQQPLERDLRLVMAIIKIISDLERSGDQAEKIARMAIRLANEERPVEGYSELYSFGDHVRKMIRDALSAFARLDTETALSVADENRKGDKGYKGVVREKIIFMMGDPRKISRSLDLIRAARALERIADHAYGIYEHVIYMSKGNEVRHTTMEEVEHS